MSSGVLTRLSVLMSAGEAPARGLLVASPIDQNAPAWKLTLPLTVNRPGPPPPGARAPPELTVTAPATNPWVLSANDAPPLPPARAPPFATVTAAGPVAEPVVLAACKTPPLIVVPPKYE